MNINFDNENEYVKSILNGGEEYVNKLASNEGKTTKLITERFRRQRVNKHDINEISSKEDAIQVIHSFKGDCYRIGLYFSKSSMRVKSYLGNLLIKKEEFEHLYIKEGKTYDEIVSIIGFPTVVTREYLKNKNSREYHIKQNNDRKMLALRTKYYNNPDKLLQAQKKRENTNTLKYGEPFPLKNSDSVLKMKKTNTDRYGEENVFKVKKFIDKQRNTTKERYGGSHYTDSLEVRLDRIKNIFKKTRYVIRPEQALTLILGTVNGVVSKDMNSLIKDYLKDNGKTKLTLSELSENILGLPYGYINGLHGSSRIQVHSSKYLHSNRRGMEEELGRYLESFNHKIIYNKLYDSIGRKQLDFYIPDLKIAFEFNGTYYHASLGSERGVSRSYHLKKAMDARDKMGITVFYVWESDWTDPIRKNILLSQIAYKMHSEKIIHIPARKTLVKKITAKEAELFFYKNHIQGGKGTSGKERFGLFYNDELVAAMTFGKRYTGNKYWELIRFANKLNTTVMGGASKLLKAFEREHENEPIMSYANNDFGFSSEKSMYTKLGFSYVKTTAPGYHWVNTKSTDVINRQKVMPKNLLLYTQGKRIEPFIGATKDFRSENPGETENEYMLRNGYLKVFNAGNDLYEKK